MFDDRGDKRVPRTESFAGCLVGQALADALGCPLEGRDAADCAKYVEHLRAGEAGYRRRGAHPFGQYTDDTQLARELLISVVERSCFDLADYAARIAALFAERRVVGYGSATEDAAWRLEKGVRWGEAGTPAPSAGNGSAMRAALIGLLFGDDDERLVQAAHDQGRITHVDPRCSAGCIAIAAATARAPSAETINVKRVCDDIRRLVNELDRELARALAELPGWVMLSPDKAAERIVGVGSSDGRMKASLGIPAFVTPSVLWSLYSFLRHPDDYWEAVCTAIGAGGDVDTTAAMTGAIVGARVGPGGLPEALARQVTDRGMWGYSQLVELAEQASRVELNDRPRESATADTSRRL